MANWTTSNIAGQLSTGLQNTISITGAQGSSSTPWQNITTSISLDDLEYQVGSHVKKYQVFEIEHDLLALSVTWYRLRKEHMNGGAYTPVSKLLDAELIKHLSGQDIAHAQLIRDYYSKKIMVLKLKGVPLSRYKQDLNSFIHSEGKIFKEDMCPLVYRLPEFYDYDTQVDQLYETYNRQTKPNPSTSKRLNLVKTLVVGKKYSKRKEYWFVDDYENLHRLSFSHDNPLLPLLDMCASKELNIAGKWRKTSKDDREFFINDKPTFG